MILDTKGPLAHGRFASCLHAEREHKSHIELYDELFEISLVQLLSRKSEAFIAVVTLIEVNTKTQPSIQLQMKLKMNWFHLLHMSYIERVSAVSNRTEREDMVVSQEDHALYLLR